MKIKSPQKQVEQVLDKFLAYTLGGYSFSCKISFIGDYSDYLYFEVGYEVGEDLDHILIIRISKFNLSTIEIDMYDDNFKKILNLKEIERRKKW